MGVSADFASVALAWTRISPGHVFTLGVLVHSGLLEQP
jgi:hypothetical protein